ncbi:MAG: peptide deformylase [Methylophilaceae bacterium]|nr:peptide deformylase [Methylophilaceae bacterium]
MTILNILSYPDPRLHTLATSVKNVTTEHKKLIKDMAETMYAAPGIGLAATQVNHHEKIIVIDISENKDSLLVLINPEIIDKRGEQVCEEGCLSVPGIYEKVTRAEWVKIQALDNFGKRFELETDGLLSVCIQHEMDHLLGKVFVEYLSSLKKSRIKSKMIKQSKQKDVL